MSQGCFALDLVPVAPSFTLAQDVALGDQLRDDLVGAALRDPDRFGDLPQPHAGVARDAQKYMRVVAEQVPSRAHREDHSCPSLET